LALLSSCIIFKASFAKLQAFKEDSRTYTSGEYYPVFDVDDVDEQSIVELIVRIGAINNHIAINTDGGH